MLWSPAGYCSIHLCSRLAINAYVMVQETSEQGDGRRKSTPCLDKADLAATGALSTSSCSNAHCHSYHGHYRT